MTVSRMKQANTPPIDSARTNPINVIIRRNTMQRRILIPSIV